MTKTLLGLPDLAKSNNDNTGCPNKFNFQINNKYLQYKYVPCNIRDVLVAKTLFVDMKNSNLIEN